MLDWEGNHGVGLSDSGYASGTHKPSHIPNAYSERTTETSEPEDIAPHRLDDRSRSDTELYDKDTVYSPSETPSLPALRNQSYIDDLAAQLFRAVGPEMSDLGAMSRIFKELPNLLRTFSLKIGYKATPTQCHIAYFLHKYRQYVGLYIH